MVKGLSPMIQLLNIMYIFIDLSDDLQYLLAITYITMCDDSVFGLGDYPLSMWQLNPSI